MSADCECWSVEPLLREYFSVRTQAVVPEPRGNIALVPSQNSRHSRLCSTINLMGFNFVAAQCLHAWRWSWRAIESSNFIVDLVALLMGSSTWRRCSLVIRRFKT